MLSSACSVLLPPPTLPPPNRGKFISLGGLKDIQIVQGMGFQCPQYFNAAFSFVSNFRVKLGPISNKRRCYCNNLPQGNCKLDNLNKAIGNLSHPEKS